MHQTYTSHSFTETSTNFAAVAVEPRVSLIPTFYTNEPRGLTEFASPSKFQRSKTNPKTFSTFPSLNISRKSLKNKTMPVKGSCGCPDVLIADDDPFQHKYYDILFQKAMKSEEKLAESQEISVHLCFSGEELIEEMDKGSKCGCDITRLVIIDYQMGEKKLNGVETSVKVRNNGYKGHLLLRTSETQDSLKKVHQDFEQLFKENIIDSLVNKNDATFGESFIQKFVKGE